MCKFSFALMLMTALLLSSCANPSPEQPTDHSPTFAEEKQAILDVIHNETKAAFQRDYEGWKKHWIQKPWISKAYMNFSDNTFSETLGWKEISQFVKTYIAEHPEPDPLPKMVDDIDLQLLGDGAWVIFEQEDARSGLKRETRLMQKESGTWKIAGMQTSIYGKNE